MMASEVSLLRQPPVSDGSHHLPRGHDSARQYRGRGDATLGDDQSFGTKFNIAIEDGYL